MSEKLVSIIVPVYNVAKYIERCVESLVKQTYENIEVILVDDGSPDDSGDIIDELALKDGRIIVIHKENEGVSSARNAGISVARGDYIMFVDGDDWVEASYVSYFLNLVERSECAIGINKNNYSADSTTSTERKYLVDSEKAIEWIYLGDVFVAVWNKIYKANLLKENDIIFNNNIWYGEGMLFNIECLQYVDKVAVGEKSVYHQTFNPNSAMRKFSLKSNYCGLESLELQKKIWKKKNKAIEDAWVYHKYCFSRSIIDGIVRADMVSANKAIFNECVHNLRKDIRIPLNIEKKVRKKIGWIGYYFFPILMAKRGCRKYKKIIESL